MGEINFTKMEGAGNDYIYVDLFQEKLSNPIKFAQKVSHRHFGIGSDGLVLIGPSERADVMMTMYNADGSESEMCGNAIRCVGKYCYDRNIVKGASISIETLSGVKNLKLDVDSQNRVVSVLVDMGEPVLEASKIPSRLRGDQIINHSFRFGEYNLFATLVSMGNPHFVTFVDDLEKIDLQRLGPMIEKSELFPNRINVEFVQILSRSEVSQRTWERGSGETFACGSGACAVCVAGHLTSQLDNRVLIHLKGGDLSLSWEGPETSVFMEGPAREVYSGKIDLDLFE